MSLNILVLAPSGVNHIDEAENYHDFYTELANHTEVKFAGSGFPDHKPDESMHETVQRVMPDTDLVIDMDHNLHNKKPRNRNYLVGLFVSDLHGKHYYNARSAEEHIQLINDAGYDVVFLRYPKLCGTKSHRNIYHEKLDAQVFWVPWSIDIRKYKPKKKDVDITFLGSTYDCYPLRKLIWGGLYYVGRGHRIVREKRPPGDPYEINVSETPSQFYVGKRYHDVLGRTRIFPFGCSIYRYPLMRFFEGTSAGCLVMSNPPSMAKYLGLVDGDTYIEINEFDWEEQLKYFLENDSERKRIASEGMKLTRKHHNHKIRAKQFLELFDEVTEDPHR